MEDENKEKDSSSVETSLSSDEKDDIVEEVVEEIEESIEQVGSTFEATVNQLVQGLEELNARHSELESRFERLESGRVGEIDRPDSTDLDVETISQPDTAPNNVQKDQGPEPHHFWFRRPSWLNWE